MEQGFKRAYDRLNDAQRQAVDQIEGPVLVIAGPGTGKTQLLSLRIANILNKTDTLPENILCLTFTDSAAQTMRERLSDIIGQAAYGVTISTYHAFGSELIRRYPDYFSREADLLPADDLAIDATLRQVMEQLPYSNLLKHEVFLRDVRQLISDCKRALITPADLRAVANANDVFIKEASELTRTASIELARVSKKSIPAFTKLLDVLSTKAATPKTKAAILPLATLWQESLKAALDEVSETGKTQPLSKWKLRWLAKDSEGLSIVDGGAQSNKLRDGAVIYESYQQALLSQELFDYDDMILQAIRGLEDNPELTYTLQERYLYLLLDEFQDTNAAQAHLVELLTDNPVNEGRPNVLAVGDDDQAIYAFQGANYSHMLNFASHYRNVLTVSLGLNYRSHTDILALSNGVALQIGTRLQTQLSGLNKMITAANSSLPKQATLERREFKTGLAQNAWVAQKVSQLIKGGMHPQEIALLAPKHEYLEALVPFLAQAAVPIHYDKRENILDDQTVQQLITMSRLVISIATDETRSASIWSRVLSYDFWQLPTSIIWEISWQAREQERSWTEVLLEHEQTRQIALFFIHLAGLCNSQPFEQMIDLLMGIAPLETHELLSDAYRSPFAAHYFGDLNDLQTDKQNFWQVLSNLTVLRERVRNYRKNELSPLMLEDFMQFVAAHQAAGIKILNTNPYQEAIDAVELMTAYRAKGQEYSVVFILASSDEVWGTKARSLGSRLSLPANLSFIRYAGASDDERLRLLYVAITRAKSQLYLTSFTSTYAGRPTTHLKYLNESLNEVGELISPLLPPKQQAVIIEDTAYTPTISDMQLHWNSQHIEALKRPDMKALLKPRLSSYQLSPTELNTFLDVSRDGPATFFLRTLLRFPSASTPSIEYGNAMHETLEWIHLFNKRQQKLPTTPQTLLTFEQHLRRKKLSQNQTNLLLERGIQALTIYLAKRGETVSRDAYSEYSFRNEGVFINDAHLNGKIDKLIVDQTAKTIVIVDYKTGKSHTRWDQSTKLHFYRHQLYFYKLLVEGSRTFSSYKVIDAYLEFVEPDEASQINELHISFNEDELSKFKELITHVWEHITELDFPVVEAYTSDTKGIIQFETDLSNGDI
jgi:DNA helicase-2/ATP-dependent DNA helicase PcrA